jgi:hypothetical protein
MVGRSEVFRQKTVVAGSAADEESKLRAKNWDKPHTNHRLNESDMPRPL